MNKLLKFFICALFIVMLGFAGFGQVRMLMPVRRYPPMNRGLRQNPVRRVELVKEGYISVRLKLTADEGRAFWPLYRQYVQDQTAIRILKRQNNSNSSIDGTVQINNEIAYEQQLVEVRKHYRDEFLKILPPEKVSELYKSEREFNDEVLKQLTERTVQPAN